MVNWSTLINAPTVYIHRSMFDEGHSDDTLQAMQDYLATLLPGEIASLEWETVNEQGVFDIDVLIRLLAGTQGHRIHQLAVTHTGQQNIDQLSKAIGSSPAVRSLSFTGIEVSPVDSICSILENPLCQLFHVETDIFLQGDLTRFFTALQRSSTVKSLYLGEASIRGGEVNSAEMFPVLCKYLECDRLLTLDVYIETRKDAASLFTSLSQCTLMERLELYGGAQPLEITDNLDFNLLPKSLFRLELNSFKLPAYPEAEFYKFLVERSLRELILGDMPINTHMGVALAACAGKTMRVLELEGCEFDNASINPLIVQLCQPNSTLEELRLEDCALTDAISAQLFTAICNANCKLKRLNLELNWQLAASLRDVMLPGIRAGACNLTKLELGYNSRLPNWEDIDAEYHAIMQLTCHELALSLRRKSLLVLLSATQTKRLSTRSAMRRLPTEMFRLVGDMHV